MHFVLCQGCGGDVKVSNLLPERTQLFCGDSCYDAWKAARDSGQQEAVVDTEEVIDTDERLQVACRRWQKWLRLLDWTVQCRFVAQEVVGAECDADIQFCREHRTAEIRIVQPTERSTDWRNADGPMVEHSLVHELLHLFFVPADALLEDEAVLVVVEQAINAISAALVG